MNTDSTYQKFIAGLTSFRRDIHQNPEFGFEETRTARQVAALLKASGLEVCEGVGGTGVVGTLSKGAGSRSIMFRADMDALKIEEEKTAARQHVSARDGYMHACGHDGHTAMLIGAAQQLAADGGFDGTVHFVFQPAEEWGRGMLAMLDDDLLRRFPASEAYALHNAPGVAIGKFETCGGAFRSAEDNFEITIQGKGCHSARPHQGRDALVAAAAVITALQTVVSRVIQPGKPAVISCTDMTTSGTRNVSTGTVVISGDCRSFSPDVSELIETEMRRVVEGVAAAHGCAGRLDYSRVFVPAVNDEALVEELTRILGDEFGGDALNAKALANTASEDFGQLIARIPGCLVNIGNGNSAPLHNPAYDFCDEAIPFGVRFFVAICRDRLKG